VAGGIRTSKTRAIANRGPRWPYVLDEQAPLAQGLKIWYPGLNQRPTQSAETTSPAAFADMSQTSSYAFTENTASPRSAQPFIEPALGGGASNNAVSGMVPSNMGTPPSTNGANNWRAGSSARANPSEGVAGEITALMWVRPVDWGVARGVVFGTDSSYGTFNWGVSIEVGLGDQYNSWNGSYTTRSTDSRFTAVAGEWRRVGAILRSPGSSVNTSLCLFDGLIATESASQGFNPTDTEFLDIAALNNQRVHSIQWWNFCLWDRRLAPDEIAYEHTPEGRFELFHELETVSYFLPSVSPPEGITYQTWL
jgi:hypothetical protein